MVILNAKNATGSLYCIKISQSDGRINKIEVKGCAPKWIFDKAATYNTTKPNAKNTVTILKAELVRKSALVSVIEGNYRHGRG